MTRLNKMPISWHERNLKNMLVYLESEIKVLKYQEAKVSELKSSCDLLNAQINKAKKLNITSFDRKEAKMNKDICITTQV